MSILIALIVFIIGLMIGSFLNVIIYRLPELQTILKTRSHCPKCKAELKWYDLIPFLSFILLKTRCRYCGKPISWQYPLVELGTALLFVILYWKFGISVSLFFSLLVSMFLIVIFVYDLLHQIIPDEMIWPAIIITLLYLIIFSLSALSSKLFASAIIGAAIGGGAIGLLVFVTRGKGMGIGDIKLGFLIGLISLYPYILISLFSAFILGGLIGIILVLANKKSFKDTIPFGPFLIVGGYISIFFGEQILHWYLNII